ATATRRSATSGRRGSVSACHPPARTSLVHMRGAITMPAVDTAWRAGNSLAHHSAHDCFQVPCELPTACAFDVIGHLAPASMRLYLTRRKRLGCLVPSVGPVVGVVPHKLLQAHISRCLLGIPLSRNEHADAAAAHRTTRTLLS